MEEKQTANVTKGNVAVEDSEDSLVYNFTNQLEKGKSKLEVEDKWILSRYNSLVKNVTESYNSYKFFNVVQELEKFLIFDLSKTYIQIIRDRSAEIYELMNEIRIGLLKLLAPI